MKYTQSWSFARLAVAVFVCTLFLSMAGVAARLAGAGTPCGLTLVCPPAKGPSAFQAVHVLLGLLAGLAVLWLFIKAWHEQRSNEILLPLTTVTAILFFGQALVGGIQVLRGFPLHLVVLHTVTAVSLWIALVSLVVISISRRSGSSSLAGSTRRPRDFLALTKPWIVALLLVTTFAGLVAGGKRWPSFELAFWTLLGGGLAAGGSSALNQYIDRELDKNMQRTSGRPLPAGRLTAAEGLAYGLGLCLISYYVLASFVNFTAAILSLAGILYYVIFYSVLLKRITVQNIVIGGGAGAIPPMVGWAAATGHLNFTAWMLFLIIFMWTPPHFWSLAIVRAKDYEHAGVPMLPVVKGEKAARDQILVYTVVLVGTTLVLPIVGAAGRVFAAAAVILGIMLLMAAWRLWRQPGNKAAWTMYRWSSLYLLFLFVALALDSLT